MDTVETLQKELAHYKKKFSMGEYDLAMDGYLTYVALVKQQVDYLKEFKLKENIEGKKTETVVYDRAMSMGEGLPDMITKMNKLKLELNIPFDENEGKAKTGATTPQSFVNRN